MTIDFPLLKAFSVDGIKGGIDEGILMQKA